MIRSVSENITSCASLGCFPVTFGQFLMIFRFDEKNHFFGHMTVYSGSWGTVFVFASKTYFSLNISRSTRRIVVILSSVDRAMLGEHVTYF